MTIELLARRARAAFGAVGATVGATVALLTPATGAAQAPASPFAVHTRPAPTGTDLALLVPERVGPFRRAPLPRDAKPPVDEDLVVAYVAGADTISFGFSIPGSARDAWEGVRMAREEAIRSGLDVRRATHVLGRDPSWFRMDRFMAWTRGAYFFYADANTPAALDRFMRAFPY